LKQKSKAGASSSSMVFTVSSNSGISICHIVSTSTKGEPFAFMYHERDKFEAVTSSYVTLMYIKKSEPNWSKQSEEGGTRSCCTCWNEHISHCSETLVDYHPWSDSPKYWSGSSFWPCPLESCSLAESACHWSVTCNTWTTHMFDWSCPQVWLPGIQ
jgi:hypothetical protein